MFIITLLTIITSVIFIIGFVLGMGANWTWLSKFHERATIISGIAMVIFSTILNIIS